MQNQWPKRKKYDPRFPSLEQCPKPIVSPNHDSWAIPEEWDIRDLFLDTSDNQLIAMTLSIWKEYMRQDEIKSAVSFLKNAPCRIRHSDPIETALNETLQTVRWNKGHKETVEITTPRDSNGNILLVEAANPMPQPLEGSVGCRYALLRDRILKPNSTVIDMGCMDGMMTNRLGLLGHKMYGYDLNENSLAIASKKAKEFNTGAQYYQGYFNEIVEKIPGVKFDTVICSDVYEHLFDANDLISNAKKIIKPDGNLVIVAPAMAWMRGVIIDWAHPWVYGVKNGTGWLDPSSPREHCIAPTVWSLVDEVESDGWWVQECRVFMHPSEIQGQGSVVLDARMQPPTKLNGKKVIIHTDEVVAPNSQIGMRARSYIEQGYTVEIYLDNLHRDLEMIENGYRVRDSSHLHDKSCDIFEGDVTKFRNISINNSECNRSIDFVFYVGQSVECWNPVTACANGIGGSETAVIEMSKRLASGGHKVRVYGDCIRGNTNLEGIFDGVVYEHHTKFGAHISCDIFVTSRKPEILDVGFKSEANYLWVHDIHCGHTMTYGRSLRLDGIFTLSDWHRNTFVNQYPHIDPDIVLVTRNGIDISRFVGKNLDRNHHKAIYSSSPDRGVEVAVRCWPRVLEAIPDAELHIFYGFDNWENTATDPNQLALIATLKELIKNHEEHGVIYHGRTDQETLANAMLSSGVWAYPSWFAETSCISAMEAQAAGLRVVSSSLAALNETVGSRGVLISGDWLSAEYQNAWVKSVVDSMRNPPREDDRNEISQYIKKHNDWSQICNEWIELFTERLNYKMSLNVFIQKYKPVLKLKSVA